MAAALCRQRNPPRLTFAAVGETGVNILRDWYRTGRRALIRSTRSPRVGGVDLGDLDRLTPVSRDWGFDRGTPVDRFYIERFMARHADSIRGRVLEVANNDYTLRYGGERVTKSDVLHPAEGNPRATVIADLARPDPSLEGSFDCIICTQTLQLVFEVRSAVSQLHRWLKPGGVLLASVPGISQISREDMQQTGDYWRFTGASVRQMFGLEFGDGKVDVEVLGNVLASVAFLHGIASEECDEASLLEADPQFQLLMTVRAVRAA
jgi:SAM-dependent methyltransferase